MGLRGGGDAASRCNEGRCGRRARTRHTPWRGGLGICDGDWFEARGRGHRQAAAVLIGRSAGSPRGGGGSAGAPRGCQPAGPAGPACRAGTKRARGWVGAASHPRSGWRCLALPSACPAAGPESGLVCPGPGAEGPKARKYRPRFPMMGRTGYATAAAGRPTLAPRRLGGLGLGPRVVALVEAAGGVPQRATAAEARPRPAKPRYAVPWPSSASSTPYTRRVPSDREVDAQCEERPAPPRPALSFASPHQLPLFQQPLRQRPPRRRWWRPTRSPA